MASSSKKLVVQIGRESIDEQTLLQLDVPETTRAISERLLAHVYRTDTTDNRTIGLMYKTILHLVHTKNPKARTKVEGLRWYAVHMRADGKKLPQKRPRPSTSRKRPA